MKTKLRFNKRKLYLKHFIIASFFTHVLVVLITLNSKIKHPLENQKIEIQYLESNISENRGKTKNRQNTVSQQKKPKPKKKIHLSQLIPSIKPAVNSDNGNSIQSSIREKNGGEDLSASAQASAFAGQISAARAMKIHPLIDSLRKEILRNLIYPNDFVEQRIEGRVNATVFINNKGEIDLTQCEVTTGPLLLQSYIALFLVALKPKPLPEYFHLKETAKIPVHLVFEFDLFIDDNQMAETSAETRINNLYFKKSAYSTPKVNEAIDEFFTYYVPPIIPLPGGVYIDFVRTYHYIENFNKTKPSAKRAVKLDLIKQKFLNDKISQ